MGQYKQSLDYFPHYPGMLNDRKLRKPKLKYGYVVNDIYQSLLELIYFDKGYYLEYSEKTRDDVIWEILNNLQGRFQPTAETVEEVIECLVACELFSGDQFKRKILTSKRIQQTYYAATVERKAVSIDFDIWLLSEKEMREKSEVSSILKNFLNRSNEGVNRSNEGVNRSNGNISKEVSKKEYIKESQEREKAQDSPSKEVVLDYFKTQGYKSDGAKFYAYYSARAWMLDGKPVRDWKALADLWEQRECSFSHKQSSSPEIEYGKYTPEQLYALFTRYTEDDD